MISTAPKQTAFGRDAQIRALGGEKLTFTRFKIGNGELSNSNPDELTDLINPLVEFPIEEIDTSNKGYVKIIGKFNSEDIKSDFRWTELGLFCKINDEAEGPYAYAYDGDDAGMLKANVSDVVADTRIALVLEVGDAENITAILSESVLYARKTDFDNHVSDDDNPHKVTKEQVGLGNVPNVGTNEQKPTFSIALKLEELTSGETLSILLGKIARAIRSLTSHLNDKNNPHNITTSTISAAKAEHTHSAADINSGVLSALRGGTGFTSLMSLAAELFKSPTFTGTPKTPTAPDGDSSQQVANTAFVAKHANNKNNPHNVTASDVGLGNVTNESKATMFSSPQFTGMPRATTANTGDSSTRVATTAFVMSAIDNLKKLIGNAYISDAIRSVNIQVLLVTNNGHSEYSYCLIACTGCTLQNGDYVRNSDPKYTKYSKSSFQNVDSFYVCIDPETVVVTPVSEITLNSGIFSIESGNKYPNSCIYVDVNNSSIWTDESDQHDEYAEYYVYDTVITL